MSKLTKPSGTIRLPDGCKPSAACSPDASRPTLTHGYLRRRDDGLWLMATDSYIAVALKVEGDAEEGWVPIEALKKMETRAARRHELTFEQIDRLSWKVSNTDRSVVTTYTAIGILARGQFPDLGAVSDGLLFSGKLGESVEPFGFDPKLLTRIGLALGGSLRAEITTALRPIRFAAIDHPDRVALQMPIRLLEERDGEMRAAA